MAEVSTLTLNNGVVMPALGLGVFQTPPDETRASVSAALEAGYRHIDTAAAYGNERQVGKAVAGSGLDLGGVRGDQDLDQRLRLRPDAARVRQERPQAGRGPDRPADPAPGAALELRRHAAGLSGPGDAAGRRQGAGDRGQQLHGRPPQPAARQRRRGAGGEPDRGPPPTSPNERCRPATPPTASSPRP